MGEMTTARVHNIDTILVILQDYSWPSADFIDNHSTCVEGVLFLARFGVSEAMVQETLRWPQCRPHFELPRNLTLFAVAGKPVSSPRGLCAMSAQCGVESHGVPPDRRVTSSGIDLQHVLHRVQSLVGPEANPMCRVATIVDHAHWEGVCGAFMVKV